MKQETNSSLLCSSPSVHLHLLPMPSLWLYTVSCIFLLLHPHYDLDGLLPQFCSCDHSYALLALS